jgi:class 3 adenylate cyclase/CHASE2 domain-containing sensor protein|tara:strand:+ start:968 stop:2626 length:1659 start_codon:yes stop_codon:yes gene_type:complete
MIKFTSAWAVIVSVVILLGIKLYNPIPLQTLQLKTFDLYQQFGDNYKSKSLLLLDISDEALVKEGQWPWKRDKLGRAIVNAYRNGAALVFLNVVFVHKDRLGGDEMFLKMISKYPVILTETDQAKNLIAIGRRALALANVEVAISVDNVIRKLPLDNSVPKKILDIIKFKVPNQNEIWIDFRHHVPRVDYADKDWSSMKGKIVFIGATFTGSTFVQTPNGLMNTHEIMAVSTETLLSGKFITRPDWTPIAEWIVLILTLTFFIIVMPRVGLLWSSLCLIGFYCELAVASGYLWQSKMIITDWSSIAIIGSIVWTHLIYNNFARENRLKLQIKKQFEHYLEPKMVKKLQENPNLLKLGGETRDMTFLFCDIRGFTPISEKFQSNPQGLTVIINKFLTPMTDIIMKNGGTIDKYMGDCIMAFWNAPIDQHNHRSLAVSSALEMIDCLKELNDNAHFGKDNNINIGIGINSGPAVVGNMGSKQRFDYSVLGDAVNLASRLEGISKNYDATLIVGYDTYGQIRNKFNFKKLDQVKVKGKSNEVSIFTVEVNDKKDN